MKKTPLRAGLALCALSIWTAAANADAVTDWNEITMAAVTASRPGPVGMLDIALVHVAVHDAVQAIDKRYEPYHVEIAARRERKGLAISSRRGSGARRARGMYPAQKIVRSMPRTMTISRDKGLHPRYRNLAAGRRPRASSLCVARIPNPLPPPFVGGTAPGMWRPTDSFNGTPPAPPPFSAMVTPWLAAVDPFTLTGPSRFRADPPPALTSERCRNDYNEVKSNRCSHWQQPHGGADRARAFLQRQHFTQWNALARIVALNKSHRVGDGARLFALANMAAADALITSWDNKTRYVFWRPLTAIREGDQDGNPHDDRRSGMAAVRQHAELSGLHVGREQSRGCHDAHHGSVVLGTNRVTFEVTSTCGRCDSEDAHVSALFRRLGRCGRSSHLSGHPFPVRRCHRAGSR